MVKTVFLVGAQNNFRLKSPLNVPLRVKDVCLIRVITHMTVTEDMNSRMLTQSIIDKY